MMILFFLYHPSNERFELFIESAFGQLHRDDIRYWNRSFLAFSSYFESFENTENSDVDIYFKISYKKKKLVLLIFYHKIILKIKSIKTWNGSCVYFIILWAFFLHIFNNLKNIWYLFCRLLHVWPTRVNIK